MFETAAEVRTRPSRRTVLIAAAACAASPILAPTGAFATPKVSQASVHFADAPRGDRRCGNCRLFQAPSSCLDVAGVVTEGCSCRIWLPKTT